MNERIQTLCYTFILASQFATGISCLPIFTHFVYVSNCLSISLTVRVTVGLWVEVPFPGVGVPK